MGLVIVAPRPTGPWGVVGTVESDGVGILYSAHPFAFLVSLGLFKLSIGVGWEFKNYQHWLFDGNVKVRLLSVEVERP